MDIKLNGKDNPSGLVTMTHIPTLVRVDSEMTDGARAKMSITMKSGSRDIIANETYYIQIGDTKIYGTLNLNKATNSTFYIAQTSGVYYDSSMAYYLLKALSNTTIINNYNIYIDKQENIDNNVVTIEAKAYGSQYNLSFDTNLPTSICTKTISTGANNDSLNGSKVVMDIYVATEDDDMTVVGNPDYTSGETITVPATETGSTGGSGDKQVEGVYEFSSEKTAYQYSYNSQNVFIPIRSVKNNVIIPFTIPVCAFDVNSYSVKSDGTGVNLSLNSNTSGKIKSGLMILYQPESKLELRINITQESTTSSQNKAPRKVVVSYDKVNDGALASNSLAGELEKTYYRDGITFDISSILANYLSYGKVIQYNIVMSYLKDGLLKPIGKLSNNYAVAGYMLDGGSKYIDLRYGSQVAQDFNVGDNSSAYLNKTMLLYNDTIRLSLILASLNPLGIVAKYCDNADNVIYTDNRISNINPDSILYTIEYTPKEMANVSYIDLVIGDIGTVRYTSIKPLKYGNSNADLNIYFTNSMGGTSFIPFTASIEEDYDIDSETYSPSAFNLYSSIQVARERVYKRDSETTVTAKSCYFPKSAKWTFIDLNNTYNAWVEDDKGTQQVVIIDSVELEEVQDGVYQATVKYKYKLI